MALALREPGSDDAEESTRYPLSPISLSEFLAREAPPLAWLIPGLVPARGVTLMVSGPNVGKTLLALDYACQAAAAGRRVLIVEEEGSLRGLQERLRRAACAADLTGEAADRIEVAWHSGFTLMDWKSRGYLIELMKTRKAEVVVLDSLAAMSVGIDENDSKEMGIVSEALHCIHAETNGAVIGLHHMNKEAWKPGQTPTMASSRGSGALMARVDSALALVQLECDSTAVRFELHNIKQREAERAKPRQVEIAMRGEAAMVTTSNLDRTAIDEAVTKVQSILPALLRLIPEEGHQGIGHIELFRKVGRRDADSRQALQMLIDERRVMETISGKLVKKKREPSA